MARQISSDKEMSPRLLLSSWGRFGGEGAEAASSLLFGAEEEVRQGSVDGVQDGGGRPTCPLSGLFLRSPAPFFLGGSLCSREHTRGVQRDQRLKHQGGGLRSMAGLEVRGRGWPEAQCLTTVLLLVGSPVREMGTP